MENPMLTKWTAAAYELQEPMDRLPLPLHVLSGEAVDVARFFDTYWPSQNDPTGKISLPGLELAARNGLFTERLGSEILELQEAMQAAQTRYLLAVEAPGELPTKRAEFVLRELQATLEFMFEDGVEDIDDARLERIAEAHQNASSQDSLAAALDDYAGLAEVHRERMQGLGGFDVQLIDEARDLAKQLRERSAVKLTNTPPNSQKQARDLRNRLATLLLQRVTTVRAAARFVFRHHPDIVRKATSTYQRNKTARYRRSSQQEQPSDQPTSQG